MINLSVSNSPAPPSPSKPLNVLVIGANGYLGSAVCRAFLRSSGPAPYFFRVHGLVRREATAPALAADEVIPIVGSISDPEAVARKVLAHGSTWYAIVVCTEPSKLDASAEEQHWRDVLSLVARVASVSAPPGPAQAVRPIVLWSSGCKDYGTTGLHGEPDLEPHTETSTLVPHPLVRGRMEGAMRAVDLSQRGDGEAGFDVATIRAAPVFGYSGSYHGAAFDYMDAYVAAKGDQDKDSRGNRLLKVQFHPGTIMHSLHVDDCGEAYVALVRTALFGSNAVDELGSCPGQVKRGREAIAGQVFNISSRRYETLEEVATALAAEYGLTGGVRFNVPDAEMPTSLVNRNLGLLLGYSQWVGSDRIRAVTDWRDLRPLFHENVAVSRLAYSNARAAGSDNVTKTRMRFSGNWGELSS